MIIQIMVEVLSILGTAMKEIKQGRISKYVHYKCENVDWRMIRKIFEEADRKDRYRRCIEEARQADTRRKSDGSCRKSEGHTCC